jgi:hypothetical protein
MFSLGGLLGSDSPVHRPLSSDYHGGILQALRLIEKRQDPIALNPAAFQLIGKITVQIYPLSLQSH